MRERERLMQQSRIFCPHSGYDDITMFAMMGNGKHPDLVVLRSQLVNNTHNGLNASALHSLVQLNESRLTGNHMNGLHVHAGAGDVSVSRSRLDANAMNGANLTYAGGLKEFNQTTLSANGLYGLVVAYTTRQEMANLFQNTTLNDSRVEHNGLGGVWLGAYCNASNITVNASVVRANRLVGLLVDSCASSVRQANERNHWYVKYWQPQQHQQQQQQQAIWRYANVNISWCLFEANGLDGVRMPAVQHMIGVVTNNTFRAHERGGGLLITANDDSNNNNMDDDSVARNVSLQIMYNVFERNSGRYALSVAVNERADRTAQAINVTFNRFEQNAIGTGLVRNF